MLNILIYRILFKYSFLPYTCINKKFTDTKSDIIPKGFPVYAL